MKLLHCADRGAFIAALETLGRGDCIETDRFSDIASSAAELLTAAGQISARGADFASLHEGIDTRSEQGKGFFALCGALQSLDREHRRAGIARAREEGKYKGRKPIAVDEQQFDAVVARWQDGALSARQAMAELGLKPNTFYRRFKDWENRQAKDEKQAGKERKKRVRAEVKEAKRAEEPLRARDVEKELRRSRRRAETQHEETVKQLQKDVRAEAKEQKKQRRDE